MPNVPAVSPLLRGDARTCYFWLRKQYDLTPTWMEFKKELRVKFADSTIRTAPLRDKLQSIAFDGSNTSPSFVLSRFKSLKNRWPSTKGSIISSHSRVTDQSSFNTHTQWKLFTMQQSTGHMSTAQKSIFDSTDKA